MSFISPARHMAWSTDKVDLADDFQRKWYVRQVLIHGNAQEIRSKDAGFDLYWFAIALNRAASFPNELERWPVKVLQPLNPLHLKEQFQGLALELMARVTGG